MKEMSFKHDTKKKKDSSFWSGKLILCNEAPKHWGYEILLSQ